MAARRAGKTPKNIPIAEETIIEIKTAKILTNYQENKPSSNEIKLAIQALRKINKWIIQCCPNFLDKLKITKVARRKEKDLMKKYIISLIF